jgi:hypothetical protein
MYIFINLTFNLTAVIRAREKAGGRLGAMLKSWCSEWKACFDGQVRRGT